jgi:formylglycine-generating enzyme required for sulfatase activity
MGCLKLFFIGLFFLPFCIVSQKTIPTKKADKLVWVKGGTTIIGDKENSDSQPFFRVKVSGFWIQTHEVTNQQFLEFIQKTGYITVAERNGGSFIFKPDSTLSIAKNHIDTWWKFEQGVDWQHPNGINSSILGKETHPVVHVAYEDACAYCDWLNMRLPTEVEWEYVARKNGKTPMNNWQGNFPLENLSKDGFLTTSPVGSFSAGKLGIFDLQGNVWEWCLDPYHQNAYYYAKQSKVKSDIPLVPSYFDEFSPNEETRVIRGGSYLCSDTYCKGYEFGRRMRSSVKTTYAHIGFRCAKSHK